MANDRAENRIKAKLFVTALSLTIAMLMLVGATYAWITISTNPEITGMRVNIYAKRTILISDTDNPQSPNAWVEHIDVSDKLGFYNQLVPVSTYDGVHWYIPTYKLSQSDSNMGTLNNPNRFILDLTPTNRYANKLLYSSVPGGVTTVNGTRLGSKYILDTNVTATPLSGGAKIDAEKLGYYLYTDLWLMTEEDEVDVRLSIPVNQDGLTGATSRNDLEGWFGTYVLPKLQVTETTDPNTNETTRTYKSLSNGSETAFRVGFLFYGDADNPNTPTDFFIYEPNADRRSSTAAIKGDNAESRYVIDESDSVNPADSNAQDPDGHVWYLNIPVEANSRYKNDSYIETRPIKYLTQTVQIPEGPLYDAAGNPLMETVTQYRRDPATGQIIYAAGASVRIIEDITTDDTWSSGTVQLTDAAGRQLYYMSAIDNTIVDVSTSWPVLVRTRDLNNDGTPDEAREERTGKIWVKSALRSVSQAAGDPVVSNQYTLTTLTTLAWEPDYLQAGDESSWTGAATQMLDALGRNLYYTSVTGGEFGTANTEWPVLIKSRTINGVTEYREEREVDGIHRLWKDVPVQLTDSNGRLLYLDENGNTTTSQYRTESSGIVANTPVYAQKRDTRGYLVYGEEGIVSVALTEKAPVWGVSYEPLLETVQVQKTGTSTVDRAEPTALQSPTVIIQKSSSWNTTSTESGQNALDAFLAGNSPTSAAVSSFGRFYSQSLIYGSSSFVANSATWTDTQGNSHTRTEKTRYYDGAFIDANLENPSESGDASAKMITLYGDTPVKVRVFFWIEGQDVDCWNDIASGELIVNLELAGFTVRPALN